MNDSPARLFFSVNRICFKNGEGKGGMTLQNCIWHGLRNNIIMRNTTRTQSLFMCFGGERRVGVRLRRARGLMGRDEGKIATGRFRSNMAAREESTLSRDVNNALNKEKLACQHRSYTVNNIVCYTAVFSVVTQRSSPQTAAENRTTFLSRD